MLPMSPPLRRRLLRLLPKPLEREEREGFLRGLMTSVEVVMAEGSVMPKAMQWSRRLWQKKD
jgi:hypothetical protein